MSKGGYTSCRFLVVKNTLIFPKILCSNFNTREFNSRENDPIFQVPGRNSFIQTQLFKKKRSDEIWEKIPYITLCSNFNTREVNSREHNWFFGHNSEPCGNFGTIFRHKLPIIHPDLPIRTRDLNSNVQPEFQNPKFLYKNPKHEFSYTLNWI